MTQTQPKVEWGFYAVTPRIVRTQYKDISHTEKWLYVCLKDLCGEKGMCFRTLRSLSEETGISIASLSTMIPNLQKAGLIHAEKKRRSLTGKEVWHITIADIWQANAKYCSEFEQSTPQFVQKMNDDVQNLNDNGKDCSENERDCSNFPYRRITLEEETITEERTIEERVANATARASYSQLEIPVTYEEALAYLQPHGPHEGLNALEVMQLAQKLWNEAHFENDETQKRKAQVNSNRVQEPPAPTKPKLNVVTPKRPKQVPVTMPVSPEAQRILDDWTSLFKRKIVLNQGDIAAAERLVQTSISKEDLGLVRLWLFSTDNPNKPWYRKIGVCLADIDKKYTQWLSLQEAPQASNEIPATTTRPTALVSVEQEKKNKERMHARAEAIREAQAKKAVGV